MTDELWPMFGQLSEVQRSVREQFQRGGSVTTALLVVAGLAFVLLIARYLTRRQKLATFPAIVNDPQRLFRDTLAKLALTTPERQALTSLATDLAIEHPTALLLSPSLLETAEKQWRTKHHRENTTDNADSEPFSAILPKLFPTA